MQMNDYNYEYYKNKQEAIYKMYEQKAEKFNSYKYELEREKNSLRDISENFKELAKEIDSNFLDIVLDLNALKSLKYIINRLNEINDTLFERIISINELLLINRLPPEETLN